MAASTFENWASFDRLSATLRAFFSAANKPQATIMAQTPPNLATHPRISGPHQRKIALMAHVVKVADVVESNRSTVVLSVVMRRPGLASRWKDPHRVHIR